MFIGFHCRFIGMSFQSFKSHFYWFFSLLPLPPPLQRTCSSAMNELISEYLNDFFAFVSHWRMIKFVFRCFYFSAVPSPMNLNENFDTKLKTNKRWFDSRRSKWVIYLSVIDEWARRSLVWILNRLLLLNLGGCLAMISQKCLWICKSLLKLPKTLGQPHNRNWISTKCDSVTPTALIEVMSKTRCASNGTEKCIRRAAEIAVDKPIS